MSISEHEFKHVMRRWVNGVAIVTSRVGEHIHGLTVSAFTGISLDPLLVMISIGHNRDSYRFVKNGGNFAVNILRSDQTQLSDLFAGRMPEVEDRFEDLAYRSEVSGAPILEDCLAWLDCRVTQEFSVGDHSIFIGEVLAADVVSEGMPLTYHDGDYIKLVREAVGSKS
jgi:flavin reductase (DIM6/NTAB) family NADH-FMN oxidoreductase RutF